jgi:hypothetical protein
MHLFGSRSSAFLFSSEENLERPAGCLYATAHLIFQTIPVHLERDKQGKKKGKG